MKILNQQKGFINTIPAVMIAVLIVTVGYFAIHQKNLKSTNVASASVASNPVSSASLTDCLPANIKLTDIVDAKIIGMTSTIGTPGRYIVRKTTVEQTLTTMNATCTNGKLVDSAGTEIYFYQLVVGCGGAVPFNYQKLLQKQRDEIIALQAQYNVIEMTCNTSGIPIP